MIELRALTESRQFQEAVELQKTVWGFNDIELLPVRLFVVATKVGGQAFGAYDGNGMVGFLLSIPGLKPGGGTYLHSRMLGVLAEYRNRGVGRMLKLRQREDALERGIGLVEWTFDPLELKNAFFNMERLGAIVRRYAENQYGITASPLHGGLPTDRCTAEWHLDSPRVRQILAGARPPVHAVERISYPADIALIRTQDAVRAREIQRTNAALFQDAFARGLAVTGFERGPDAGSYLLEPWQ